MTGGVADIMDSLAAKARAASRVMASASTERKNAALTKAAALVRERAGEILEINAVDVSAAKSKGQDAAFIDRMELDPGRIEGIAEALENVAALDDPVGKSISKWSRPNGLEIERVRTPIGVIAVIYLQCVIAIPIREL